MAGRKKKSKESAADKDDIIPLEEGWKRIQEVGVVPFLDRVESMITSNEEKAEDQLKHQSIPQKQFTETYDTIFNMCIQREPYNFSEPLYSYHGQALTDYFKKTVIPALSKARDKHGLALLQEWNQRWRANKWVADGLRRMFMYLDRFYVPNSEDLLTMSESGFSLFRKHVFDKFKDPVRDAVLDCIRREREHEDQDRDVLRESIAVFVELGQKLSKVDLQLYKEDFEKSFVEAARQFYQVTSRAWMEQDSCPDYMVKAEKCVEEEEGRLQTYIHQSTREALMRATRDELLKRHQNELLQKQSGIAALLERESRPDLARMYRLFESVEGGLQPVADAMREHVKRLGNNFIEDSKNQKDGDKNHELVRNLISLHERFHGIVNNNFHNNQLFQKALKEAFEDFINREYYTSNLLARFINDVLKKGSKVAVEDLERTLDHVVMLYGYIRDKDIFERDYQLFLSNRLLQGLSQSEQAERRMIGKLKTECGYQWTSKLESMFKDVQLSNELNVNFRRVHGDKFGVELYTNVCTTGCWPSSSIPPCNLPPQLKGVTEAFKKFYLNQHSGRRLQWRCDQGKADVMVQFNPKTKKVLSVSTYQMMVLLLFCMKDKISFKEMQDQTQIPTDELQAHVLSLAHPKVKVLLKNPNTNKVADDHEFMINSKYKNALYKVKVPLLMKLAKNNKEIAELDKQNKIRRRHMIDAAIVRIMKTRKTLKHPQLAAEVVDQLKARFMPSGTDIKKRIESLIEQEYLDRYENFRSTYN
jgi:cullin 1